MTVKKYRLGEKHKTDKLYRVIALRDFGDVKAGDVGGWVEGEHNLSHEGNCWVAENGAVFGRARVSENALVKGNACVSGNAHIYGHAVISGDAKVLDNVLIFGWAQVADHTRIYDDAQVYGRARIFGYAHVQYRAKVYGEVQVGGSTIVSLAELSGRVKASGFTVIHGGAVLSQNEELVNTRFCGPLHNQLGRPPSKSVAPESIHTNPGINIREI